MILLAVSAEARFQALVTLIGGVILILGAVVGFVWRTSRWIRQQSDAIRENTEALKGTDGQPGLIQTVTDLQRAVDRLADTERGRGRHRW